MNRRILCVDDDPNILNAIRRNLRKQFEIDTAESGVEALERLSHKDPYAVICVDMKMPGMNGVELLEKVRTQTPDTVRMMLTGNADQQTAIESVNRGQVFMFMCKPCSSEMLGGAFERGVEQYRLITSERELLEKTLSGSVRVLTDILAQKDPAAFGFSEKLRERVCKILPAIPELIPWEIELTALLSQIGLLTVPEHIVEKQRAGFDLSPAERDILASASEAGGRLLTHVPRLEGVCQNLHLLAKNYDGSGKPYNHPGGESIPLGARLLRICGDLILLERRFFSQEVAIEQIYNQKAHYDPKLLKIVIDKLTVTAAVESESVPLTKILSGAVLAEDVSSVDGLVLMTAGTQLTAFLIERLKNFRKLELVGASINVVIPAKEEDAQAVKSISISSIH